MDIINRIFSILKKNWDWWKHFLSTSSPIFPILAVKLRVFVFFFASLYRKTEASSLKYTVRFIKSEKRFFLTTSVKRYHFMCQHRWQGKPQPRHRILEISAAVGFHRKMKRLGASSHNFSPRLAPAFVRGCTFSWKINGASRVTHEYYVSV